MKPQLPSQYPWKSSREPWEFANPRLRTTVLDNLQIRTQSFTWFLLPLQIMCFLFSILDSNVFMLLESINWCFTTRFLCTRNLFFHVNTEFPQTAFGFQPFQTSDTTNQVDISLKVPRLRLSHLCAGGCLYTWGFEDNTLRFILRTLRFFTRRTPLRNTALTCIALLAFKIKSHKIKNHVSAKLKRKSPIVTGESSCGRLERIQTILTRCTISHIANTICLWLVARKQVCIF